MTTKKRAMRRWTWERVHEAVESNLNGWEITQEEPERVTGGMKLKLKCSEEHENIKRPNNIENGVGLSCRQCQRETAFRSCYDKYEKALHNEGWKMISEFEEFLQSNKRPSMSPLKVKCPHGNELTKRYDSFSSGNSRCICPKCRPHGRKLKRWTLGKARQEYEKRGFIFKGEEWKTTHDKYETKCRTCSHIWSPTFNRLIYKNNGC